MKTLILWLALAVACSAQTLKWSTIPPPPPFEFDHGIDTMLSRDVAGTLAVGISYTLSGTPVGTQILWYSSAGKLLKAESFTPPMQVASIIYVSPTTLVVSLTNGASSNLRKYSRRGNLVLSKDTPFGQGESPITGPSYSAQDRVGIFSLCYSASGLSTIKRYSYR